jgi:hypothetical protein
MTLERIKKVGPALFAVYVSRSVWLHRRRTSLAEFVENSGFVPSVFGFKSIKKVRSLTTPSGIKKLYVQVE